MDGCIYRTKDGECDLYADGGKYHAFCVGDAPCDGRKQSNADKIRQMSDEELVDIWYFIYQNVLFAYTNSRQGLLDWLKQEVEESEN